MSLKFEKPTLVLVMIVLAQFLCTSLWFAGNSVVADLIAIRNFPLHATGNLTSAIQFGFISGTLIYAILNIADRYSPSRVFLVSAILASLSNLWLAGDFTTYPMAITSRFLTGFFLAGIYPVGMKIAADHFDKTLGKSLGLLVGALVLGTALPHLIRSYLGSMPYRYVLYCVSFLALIGGSLIGIFIPDGPYRKSAQKIQFSKTFETFRIPEFRGAAFGYFGHMWELYTFFTFLPAILLFWSENNNYDIDLSFWSFIVIALGGLGCALSGYLSNFKKPKLIATVALMTSGVMCFITPFLLITPIPVLFFVLMALWGTTISADSPMFSTLVAKSAPPELKGTSLTIVNCIGFALTIVSIQLLSWMSSFVPFQYLFIMLGIGPVLGLYALRKNA